MTRGLTITKRVHFEKGRRTRKVLKEGSPPEVVTLGPVPRLSRLMALAIYMEGLIREGHVADYAELARLAQVSRARITQIMNLLHLAPDIQEEILFAQGFDRAGGAAGAGAVREETARLSTGFEAPLASSEETVCLTPLLTDPVFV